MDYRIADSITELADYFGGRALRVQFSRFQEFSSFNLVRELLNRIQGLNRPEDAILIDAAINRPVFACLLIFKRMKTVGKFFVSNLFFNFGA